MSFMSPALACVFFTTRTTWGDHHLLGYLILADTFFLFKRVLGTSLLVQWLRL